MNTPNYLAIMQKSFDRKKAVNPRFSLRAFANFLNIDSSSLSSILKGKRPLPLARAHDVAQCLGLEGEERRVFMQSLEAEHTKIQYISGNIENVKKLSIENDAQMRMLLSWEYLAIYALLATVQGQFRPLSWVAQRLMLEEDVARECLDDLVAEGIVEVQANEFRKKGDWVQLKKMRDMELMISAQMDCINVLIAREQHLTWENSYLSSVTFSADPDKLESARKIIDEFRTKLASLMRHSENNKEVYQLNVQLFPLTIAENKKS